MRTVRHGNFDEVEKHDRLAEQPRSLHVAETLRWILFRDTTTTRQRIKLDREDDPPVGDTGYVELFPDHGRYLLRDRPGACPTVGEHLEAEDGVSYIVLKVARSPLPNDTRRCVYLEPRATLVNHADEPPLQR